VFGLVYVFTAIIFSIVLVFILRKFAFTPIFMVVIYSYILSELAKKIGYILVGEAYGRLLSSIAMTPLLIAVIVILVNMRAAQDLSKIVKPTVAILTWFLCLVVFSILSSRSILLNPLPLGVNLVILFWFLSFIDKKFNPEDPRLILNIKRSLKVLLIYAVGVGAFNIFIGIDPLWHAYSQAAEDFTIGAYYTPDKGYSGSIFASSTDYGLFVLAITAIISAFGVKYYSLWLTISLLGALTSGSRYILFGMLIFWIIYWLLKYVRLKPIVLIAIFFSFSFFQDIVITNLLQSTVLEWSSQEESVVTSRLVTIGTLNSRLGFSENFFAILRNNFIIGSGVVNYWQNETLDDRHNLILRLLNQTGLLGSIAFLLFIVWHILTFYRSFSNGEAIGRTGISYLMSALVLSLGGPSVVNPWFFLTLGLFSFHIQKRFYENSDS